eukprot:CAMPEP_0178391954 /NCGR_PEP_ID=MMETSP0689_2-20121128/11431_1 /TAXON_ID=160604 /ORGANISM="Amphidinium massartii, Strain CS-259" /LENGTH=30 /DNA_ID= /DNA_START= /DNA_END= /DNA_ORIENTATION=
MTNAWTGAVLKHIKNSTVVKGLAIHLIRVT